MSSIYDYDPDTGLPRPVPQPDTDEQVTALREAATAERYRVPDAIPALSDDDSEAQADAAEVRAAFTDPAAGHPHY